MDTPIILYLVRVKPLLFLGSVASLICYFVIVVGPPSLLPFWTFNIFVSLPCWFVIFARFVTIVIFVGTHPLVRLYELLFLCLSLAWFVIFVIFVGLLSLLSFKNWLFLCLLLVHLLFSLYSVCGAALFPTLS